MRNCLAIVLVAVISTPALAAEFRLLEGKGKAVCNFVVTRLQDSEDLIPGGPESFLGKWNWKQGTYHWISETMDKVVPTLYAQFDINNDGSEETILRQSWSIRSHENDALFIFKAATIDFSKTPRLTSDELRTAQQISSGVNYPYGKHGLFLLLTGPLAHEGVNYVVLMDELFGRVGFPERTLVVARYTGVPMDLKTPTDRLEIICKVKPVTPFLPYDQQN